MIPKTIHYCWFGRGEKPALAKKCIASWHKFFPDYEIKEWNEGNFDLNICQYTREAYEAKKYAFVSDYARFWILYNHGGIYFDTDVEVIKPLHYIIEKGPFMGIEKSLATQSNSPSSKTLGVAPGLGLGATPALGLYKEILEHYKSRSYTSETQTVVGNTTEILRRHGFKDINSEQFVAGVTIYPTDVFCPMDSTTGLIDITPDTVSIHHYSCSWMDHKSFKFRLHKMKNKINRIIGPKMTMYFHKILK